MVKKIKSRTKKEKAASTKLQTNLQFAKAHLVETELIFEECLQKFNEKFYDYGKDEGGNADDSTDMRVPPPKDESAEQGQQCGEEPKDREREEVSLPEDEDIRKIFKKIALKTHPDKLRDVDEDEVQELTELYKEAAEAASLSDGGELLMIAAALRIRIDIDFEKEVKWATEKITKLKNTTSNIKKTDAWLWFHSEGKQRKKIEKFINERMNS